MIVVPAKAGTQSFLVNAGRDCTLYVGVTSNLASRIEAHRLGLVDDFTRKYDVKILVYFELHDEMYEAIQREKIQLIEQGNPEWSDLSDQAG